MNETKRWHYCPTGDTSCPYFLPQETATDEECTMEDSPYECDAWDSFYDVEDECIDKDTGISFTIYHANI